MKSGPVVDAYNRLVATRWGRIALSGASSLAARSIAMLTLLFVVPFASATLGPDMFGLWIIVSGFGMIFGFADLGIGGSVINAVALASARDDAERVRIAISNGLAAMAGIALCFAAIGAVATLWIDWQALLSIGDPAAAAQARPAVLAFIACFALNMSLSVVNRAQAGLQRMFIANAATIAGSLAAFAATLHGLHAGWQVPALILALFALPVVATIANHVVFFHFVRPDLRPRLADVRLPELKAHLRTGLAFFGMQLGAIALIRFDAMIVANRAGLAAGGVFSALDRLFAMTVVLSNALLGPLWPAYREAIAVGDHRWWKRALVHSTLAVIGVVGIAGAGIVLLAPQLSAHWLRIDAAIPVALLAAFVFMRVFEATYGSISAFLNGAGMLRYALASTVIAAAAGLVLKIWFVPATAIAIALAGGAVYLAWTGAFALTFLRGGAASIAGPPSGAASPPSPSRKTP